MVLPGALPALALAASLPALNALFGTLMRRAGFTAYAIGYLPRASEREQPVPARRSPFLLLDWPQSWLELYAREGFVHDDIVVAEAARAQAPFTWAEVKRAHPGASARVFAAAAAFGWTDGLVVPLRAPQAEGSAPVAVASLAGGSLEGMGDDDRDRIVEAATVAFGRASELAARPAVDVGPKLSPRERQALKLCAEGLSDAGIAGVMKITPATAHFHVERAKRALGAATRAQAVALALSLDLL